MVEGHSEWSFADQACHCEVQEDRSSELVNIDTRSQRPLTASRVSSLQVFKVEHVRRRVYRHLQHVTLEYTTGHGLIPAVVHPACMCNHRGWAL